MIYSIILHPIAEFTQALLLSARLSPTAVHHLLSKTATRAIIVSPRLRRTAQEALSLFATTGVVPATYSQDPFTSFLDVQQSRQDVGTNICREGSEAQDSDRNVLILHSSGTTGLPKPIYHSHKWLLSFATCHDFTSEEEALSLSLSTLPLYHVRPPSLRCRHRLMDHQGLWSCHSGSIACHR